MGDSLTSLSPPYPHASSKGDNVIPDRANIGSYRVKKIFLFRSNHRGHKQIQGISVGFMFLEGGVVIRKN